MTFQHNLLIKIENLHIPDSPLAVILPKDRDNERSIFIFQPLSDKGALFVRDEFKYSSAMLISAALQKNLSE